MSQIYPFTFDALPFGASFRCVDFWRALIGSRDRIFFLDNSKLASLTDSPYSDAKKPTEFRGAAVFSRCKENEIKGNCSVTQKLIGFLRFNGSFGCDF